MEQWHVQDWAAAQVAGNSQGALQRQQLPQQCWQSSMPLAHDHPEVAAEWDWNTNGERTPETVMASSNIKAAWECGICRHSWTAAVAKRTKVHGTGCPECAHEARRHGTRQPSISEGAPRLLAEWDWEANERRGWHPDQVTLGSHLKVHWVVQDECKLGLVHRWQATPNTRTQKHSGSPFPSGMAVCACNSLAVQCPEAAELWDPVSNRELTPGDVAMKSNKVVEGSRWFAVAAASKASCQ